MRSKDLSRPIKLTLYQTLILPVLLYGDEAWVVSQTDAAAFGVSKGKILRKIFDPLRVGDNYYRRMNHELYEPYDEVDIVKRINIQRLRRLSHVERMDAEAPAKKGFGW